MMKQPPPHEVQELLKIIGFYSDGFCTGHCEHAPLRDSNPELNSVLEAWHDRYYKSPDIDELAGVDTVWQSVANNLARAMTAFSPEKWHKESDGNLGVFFLMMSDWMENFVIPGMEHYYEVKESLVLSNS